MCDPLVIPMAASNCARARTFFMELRLPLTMVIAWRHRHGSGRTIGAPACAKRRRAWVWVSACTVALNVPPITSTQSISADESAALPLKAHRRIRRPIHDDEAGEAWGGAGGGPRAEVGGVLDGALEAKHEKGWKLQGHIGQVGAHQVEVTQVARVDQRDGAPVIGRNRIEQAVYDGGLELRCVRPNTVATRLNYPVLDCDCGCLQGGARRREENEPEQHIMVLHYSTVL